MAGPKLKYLELLLLGIVITIAAFLYLYKLDKVPSGLYIDEAGTAYNAYSILKSGKDEYGKAFPIAFRLFGSYSPPLYIYLSVPVIATFGLSVLSARLPSVMCTIFSIIAVFAILKRLNITRSKLTPVVGAFIFATTPWTVFFARVGYEQSLGFLMFSVSILLVIESLKRPKLIAVILPLLSLATYADYPQRVLSPLVCILAILLLGRKMFAGNNLRYLAGGAALAVIIQIPNIYLATTPSFYTKVQLLTLSLRGLLARYLTYFSPKSLFFLPDPDTQRSIPALSVLYPWLIVPYFVGTRALFKEKLSPKIKLVIFVLLLCPLPASLTQDPFHSQRSLPLLLPIILVISLGIDWFITRLKVRIWLPALLILVLSSLVFLWRSYFVLLPKLNANVWGYKYPILAEFIKANPDNTFVIDQNEKIAPQDVAYIQMAFYLKLPPQVLQDDQKDSIITNYYQDTQFTPLHSFGRIEFKPIDWGEAKLPGRIFIGDQTSISDTEVRLHSLTKILEIRDPNEQVVLRGFKR